jgi:hypothetical protein
MDSKANVLSIQALEDLKGALGCFGSEAQEVLNATALEIRRTQDWLAERQGYWQSEAHRRQEVLAKANAALATCRASRYRDPKTGAYYEPPCTAQLEAVRKAQEYLTKAETELRNVQQWTRLVQQAVADFQRQAQRMATLLGNDLSKAIALLGRSVTILQSYAAIVPLADGIGMIPMERSDSRGGSVEEIERCVTGSSDETRQLHQALSRLKDTDIGCSISEAILKTGTTIRFGQIENGTVAYFDPERNEIMINNNLQNASPEIMAAHLAHEGTHVQWNRDGSINQEYHAFCAQAEVWSQVKGNETDRQCDTVRWMISLGEKEAKSHIRRLYPNLPEDA